MVDFVWNSNSEKNIGVRTRKPATKSIFSQQKFGFDDAKNCCCCYYGNKKIVVNAKLVNAIIAFLENWQLWKHESKEGIHLPNQMTIWWDLGNWYLFPRVLQASLDQRHINHPLIFTGFLLNAQRMPNTWFPWPTYYKGVTYVIILWWCNYNIFMKSKLHTISNDGSFDGFYTIYAKFRFEFVL